MTKLKDGVSQQQAASISTNVDNISTNINNMSISNSKDDNVSNTTERGEEAEIPSTKKESTSYAQNLVHCKNDISTRENHTSGSCNKDGVSDALKSNDTPDESVDLSGALYHLRQLNLRSGTTNTDVGGISNDNADKNLISNDDLFKDPPPKEDCPICMLPMPFAIGECGVGKTYMAFCGKVICCACMIAARDEMKKGNIKRLCAFCRVPLPSSIEEMAKRYRKRMKLIDPEAYNLLGDAYYHGYLGSPKKDVKKSFELWSKAAELGSVGASYTIAQKSSMNDKNKVHHYKVAAIGGHEVARYKLGIIEMSNSNIDLAMKHYIIAARAGNDKSLAQVRLGYKEGCVTKDEYASTLRAHKDSQDEMKCDQRTAVDYAKTLRAHQNTRDEIKSEQRTKAAEDEDWQIDLTLCRC